MNYGFVMSGHAFEKPATPSFYDLVQDGQRTRDDTDIYTSLFPFPFAPLPIGTDCTKFRTRGIFKGDPCPGKPRCLKRGCTGGYIPSPSSGNMVCQAYGCIDSTDEKCPLDDSTPTTYEQCKGHPYCGTFGSSWPWRNGNAERSPILRSCQSVHQLSHSQLECRKARLVQQ